MRRGGGGATLEACKEGGGGGFRARCPTCALNAGGSHGRVPSAPTELEAPRLCWVKSAEWWPGHVPLARVAPCKEGGGGG